MPFTFSHPAIVLPLKLLPKRWISLTGLVIGSMTPDFEYFMRMSVKSNYSHTIGGVFWFDLPLGLLLAFLFHNVVRNTLFKNLPMVLKSRFLAYRDFDWNGYFRRNFPVVIISILIGAFSHILWDSFTHFDGYFVQLIPLLQTQIDLMNEQISVFKILQHSSTLLGGLIIAFAIYKLPRNIIEKGNIDSGYWVILAVTTLLVIAARFLIGLNPLQFGDLIVTAISAGLISLVIAPVILKQFRNEES